MEYPVDVINLILQQLETKDMILASWICEKWRRAFTNNIGKYKIDLSPYGNKITDTHLEHLKGIHMIKVPICLLITDKGWEFIKTSNIVFSYSYNVLKIMDYMSKN